MSDLPSPNNPNRPIIGFVAGTPLRTPEGQKSIEELRPGDMIETQPNGDQADDKPEADNDEPHWWENN